MLYIFGMKIAEQYKQATWRHAGNKKKLATNWNGPRVIVLFRVKQFVISFDSFSEYLLYLQVL